MKCKFEIKNWAGSVLFTYESEKEATVKDALTEAVQQGANLEGAYLGGANLEGAYLGGAYLRGANLRGAYLEGAYLGGAYLRGAYLRGAYLGGAYLGGAYLRGAYLRGAKGITPQVLQIIGTRHMLIVHEYGVIQIGCHEKTPAQWAKYYKKIGEAEGYTPEQIAEYREHIAHATKFMERYGLMTKPEEKQAATA